tara:strand:- start:62 stop:916 length:855 start_codon:yes stop_codon:yes gene_type:complete
VKFLKINNKSNLSLDKDEDLFHSLGQFAQKEMGFKKPPALNLVSDEANAGKSLGKTAYYDPQSMSVTIYTDGRHTKDILRSLAHELVHHTQNENGMLNDSGYHGAGYAQKNKDLRQSEKEAYLKGNMCFRDWEDGLKQDKPTIYNEWRINNMSTKEWKNKELMENISDKFGFKMNLNVLKENKEKEEDKLEEAEKPDFPDVDGDGDKEEPISKAQEDKKEKESGKKEDSEEKSDEEGEEKSDKDLSKVPPQLRKHVGKSMKESRMMKIIKNEIRKQIKELKKSK